MIRHKWSNMTSMTHLVSECTSAHCSLLLCYCRYVNWLLCVFLGGKLRYRIWSMNEWETEYTKMQKAPCSILNTPPRWLLVIRNCRHSCFLLFWICASKVNQQLNDSHSHPVEPKLNNSINPTLNIGITTDFLVLILVKATLLYKSGVSSPFLSPFLSLPILTSWTLDKDSLYNSISIHFVSPFVSRFIFVSGCWTLSDAELKHGLYASFQITHFFFKFTYLFLFYLNWWNI